MKVISIFLLFAIIVTNINGEWTIFNSSIPISSDQSFLSFNVTTTKQYTLFHCFGAIDWYVGFVGYPTTTDYYQVFPWAGYNSVYHTASLSPPVVNTIYFTFTCADSADDSNGNCAHFSLVQSDSLAEFLVTPPNPVVTGRYLTETSVQISWQKTSDSADTYSVYYSNLDPTQAPLGCTYSTECGIKRCMMPFNSGITFNDTGNGAMTATFPFSLLNSPDNITVAVVANRAGGGIGGVYNYFTFVGSGRNTATTGTVSGQSTTSNSGTGQTTNSSASTTSKISSTSSKISSTTSKISSSSAVSASTTSDCSILRTEMLFYVGILILMALLI